MTSDTPRVGLRRLAVAATLGSERAGGESGSPAQMLAQAAVLGARARAGYQPGRASTPVPECPEDPRPIAGTGAAAMLTRLLAGPDAWLIEEWSACALARGWRVPDVLVPSVLEWWSRQPRRAEVVFEVCGATGRWLATMNPAWGAPPVAARAMNDLDAIWQTGKTAERAAALMAVRREDAARGLEMVRSTWSSEGAEERKRFVEALGERVSGADEAFLEAALDDRSKAVRHASARVLARLEGSQYRARCEARARGLVLVSRAADGAVTMALQAPTAFDRAWERDGIEEQAAGATGKRAWWLQQIVSAADLDVWTRVSGLDPDGVLDALSGDDYFAAALEGIMQAVRWRADARWVGAVVRQQLKGKEPSIDALATMITLLPAKEAEPLILQVAGHGRMATAERWRILAIADHWWTKEFSAAALALVGRTPPAKKHGWVLQDATERVSRVVSPALADEFSAVVGPILAAHEFESFQRAIDRVNFRAEMHKEFAT